MGLFLLCNQRSVRQILCQVFGPSEDPGGLLAVLGVREREQNEAQDLRWLRQSARPQEQEREAYLSPVLDMHGLLCVESSEPDQLQKLFGSEIVPAPLQEL